MTVHVQPDEADQQPQAQYDFDEAFQRKIAMLLLCDTNFAMTAKDVLRPEYFTEDATAAIVAMTLRYIQGYRAAPGKTLIPQLLKDEIDAGRIRKDLLQQVKQVLSLGIRESNLANPQYVLDKIIDFAKSQAIMQAMQIAIDELQKGDYKAIEKRFKEAFSIGSTKGSEGYDYWHEIDTRTQQRIDVVSGKAVKRGITSGYTEIDANLYHGGWGRQELSVIMGGAKSGKTISLADFTKNASLAGYNTFYGSCEVSTRIIAERMDANVADVMMKDLHMKHADVEAAVKRLRQQAGKIILHDFPSGTLKVTQLHRLLERYRDDGLIFDLITIDYADIMAPEYRSDRLIDNLREIYIDLRALAHEFDAAVLTATQTNREGARSMTAKATDVGDDFNKVRTADVLIGINATDAEKAAGEARLYWAASRNTEDGFTIRIQQDRSRMKFITRVLGRV